MRKEFLNVKELYDELKINREREEPVWQEICKVSAITLDMDYGRTKQRASVGSDLAEFVDDPTAALAVMQAGDYLAGILWGNGNDAFTLEPSDDIAMKTDPDLLRPYYSWRTSQALGHMNHNKAGFLTALKPFCYDQVGIGTSGIGCFKNEDYPVKEDNPYVFRNYGVDNICIDEGKSGRVDVIFVVCQWRTNRIVKEFESAKDKLPKKILQDFEAGRFNEIHTIVQGIYPREDYERSKKGKKGTQYKGVWFMDDSSSSDVFFEEDFRCLPIGICRAIKVRGEVYGRSSGSLLIGSIKAVQYLFSQCVETIQKMNNPALGTWNRALFGDSVLDTSAGGLAVFNQGALGAAQNPVFKMYDTGDPSALINFLIPYLNEKIATGFKVDILLDFAAEAGRTATEMMQRSVIRGKALTGILGQLTGEMLDVNIERAIQLEDDMGLAGINPILDIEGVKTAQKANRAQIVIPDEVLKAMNSGKRWYKIRYNNELGRMGKTESLERIMQCLNGLSMMAAIFPQILEAVDFYAMWKDINESLGVSYFKNEQEFKDAIDTQAQAQRTAMALQAGQAGADIQGKVSKAKVDEANAGR